MRLSRQPRGLAPDTPTADIRIGYARCSTLTHELQSQLNALAKHGIERDKVFSEKISTRVRVRPQFEAVGPRPRRSPRNSTPGRSGGVEVTRDRTTRESGFVGSPTYPLRGLCFLPIRTSRLACILEAQKVTGGTRPTVRDSPRSAPERGADGASSCGDVGGRHPRFPPRSAPM
ncbi:recombinase family protein [Streptomyces melanogenes]|uniref:recombinase family protein n=1 Tax=Streptomyces melanogenes TaxID=67326 RepID=UPI0035716622